MARPAPSPLESDIGAALDWWRVAGVDASFSDEAQGWLSDSAGAETEVRPVVAAAVAIPEAAPAVRTGGPRDGWPDDLGMFRQWWLAEPSLDEGGLAPRIAPSGEVEAELMVLVAMPEEADRDTLLSGAHGRLLSGFLSAAGLSSDKVYRASVLPRNTPLPDWDAMAAHGMGEIIAHHVALVRPKRVLVLGRNILPLCGHDPAQGPAALAFLNHEGGRVPALAEAGLERLLGNAQLRARLWKRWLAWTR